MRRSNYFKQFEKDLKEISSYFRIIPAKFPYAYIYWKDKPFEQVIPSIMKEYDYTYKEDLIVGSKSMISIIKRRYYLMTH